MKKPMIILIVTVIFCIIIPVLVSVLLYGEDNLFFSNNTVTDQYETIDSKSPNISVYNSVTNEIETTDLETFLYGVVSMEMSSDFSEEALKAQAVAARTYVIYKIENKLNKGHKGADICNDYSHCQAYASYDELKKLKGDDWIKNYYPIIKKAVDETKGHILTYNNKSILPLYFSTSSGRTENSQEVFMTQYPYLKSVDSPYEEESPKYETEKTITKKQFINLIKKENPNIKLTEKKLEDSINIISKTTAGSIETIKIGNVEFSGRDFREIFELNSANFDILFKNKNVVFKVKGYGHGVGMSQWGAEGMAENGYKYDEILFHYYTDTKIKDIY